MRIIGLRKSKTRNRLDRLEGQQKEILGGIAKLQATEDFTAKAVTFQITYSNQRERLKEPPKSAWIAAVGLLLLSGILLTVSAWGATQESSSSSEAASMHQTANEYQVQAFGLIFQAAQSSYKMSNTTLQRIKAELQYSENIDASADKLDSSDDRLQILTQVNLGVASALFGAVAGWILTQMLAGLINRKTINELRETIKKSGLTDTEAGGT